MDKTEKQKSLLFLVLLIIVISCILIEREKKPVQSPYHINKVPNFKPADIDQILFCLKQSMRYVLQKIYAFLA